MIGNSAIRLVRMALDKEESKSEEPKKKELSHKPENSSYLITYLTNSFDINGTRVTMDYGPNMERNKYTREQLEEVGFTNHGDNFRWSELYWKFFMDKKPVVYKAGLDESGRKTTESIEFGSEIVRVGGDHPLQISDLHNLDEYPFSSDGYFKMGKSGELFLPGNIFFLDVSDGKGKEVPGKVSLDSLKTEQGSKSLLSKAQSKDFIQDDGTGNNYRYWKNNALNRISGQPDANSTKIVNEILSRPLENNEAPGEEGSKSKSVFEPQGESHRNDQMLNGNNPGDNMRQDDRFKSASEDVNKDAVSDSDVKNQKTMNKLKKDELKIDQEKQKINNQYGVAASTAIDLVQKHLNR